MIDDSFLVSPPFGAPRILSAKSIYEFFVRRFYSLESANLMYMYVENRIATRERLLLYYFITIVIIYCYGYYRYRIYSCRQETNT